MAFSKHFSCFPKELKAKLSHGTGNLECYFDQLRGCYSREEFSPCHTDRDFELQNFRHWVNPWEVEAVWCISLNPLYSLLHWCPKCSRDEHPYQSVSLSMLNLLLPLVLSGGYWLFLSTVLMDPHLWGGTLWVLGTLSFMGSKIILPPGQETEGLFPWLAEVKAWVLLMFTSHDCKRNSNYLLR